MFLFLYFVMFHILLPVIFKIDEMLIIIWASVSDPDPHLMAALIRIRMPNADRDSGGLKRAKKG
jgi:hypothetical protein